MKKTLYIFILVYISALKINAQEHKLSANIDVISIMIESPTEPQFLTCDSLCESYNPITISLGIYVKSNSCEDFLFGSNTLGHFRNNDTIYTKNGLMGRFYLVNGNDSTLLLSREYARAPISHRGASYNASIDYIDSFGNKTFKEFLCKFTHNDKEIVKRTIYDYLEKSHVVYIPSILDYEEIIDKYYSNRVNNLIYPEHIIKIEMPNPLYVVFGELNNDSESEILGRKDFIYR